MQDINQFDTVELFNQVKKIVASFEDEKFSVEDIAKWLIKNNSHLAESKGHVSEERKKFWNQGAKRFLDRLVKEGVLKDNKDGTYSKI